jgi:hypothetical protein
MVLKKIVFSTLILSVGISTGCKTLDKLENDIIKHSAKTETHRDNSISKTKNKVKEKKIVKLSGKELCNFAGYTLKQMKSVNYECMSKEDLQPYMSSNTYKGIKLGAPIENYTFLKKSIYGSFEGNRTNHRIKLDEGYAGDIYHNRGSTPVGGQTIYVLTRFGLVDTIVVQLGKLGKTAVLNKLKNKYTLFKSREEIKRDNWNRVYKKYNQFERKYRPSIFKNGEDNIFYYLDGSYYSEIIYSSNAYDIINILAQEAIATKKKEDAVNKKNSLNDL